LRQIHDWKIWICESIWRMWDKWAAIVILMIYFIKKWLYKLRIFIFKLISEHLEDWWWLNDENSTFWWSNEFVLLWRCGLLWSTKIERFVESTPT
jgi:hypothetical protein